MTRLAVLGSATCAFGIILLCQNAPAAAVAESSRVSLGVTSVRWPWGDDAEVCASLTVRNASHCELNRPDYYGGPPRTVVTRLLVTVGGDTAFIPFRAYCDLSEPRTIAVACGKDTITITITGGKAEGTYSATFVVSDMMLRKRSMEAYEFADEDVLEETTYTYFGPGD